jgi:hypothetical protein
MATKRFQSQLILGMGLIMFSFDVFADHVPNQIEFNEGIDQHGVGFGFSLNATSGGYWFYDYNLHDSNKQIHLQYETRGRDSQNGDRDNLASVSQLSFHGAYRHDYNSGWYVGLIGGWYQTSLKVQQTGISATEPDQDLSFYHRGWLVGPEVGWQGNDFYYFTVGFRNLGRIQIAEDYKYWDVYDGKINQKTVGDLWDYGKNYSAIYFSFGWYLQAQPERSSASDSSDKVDERQLLEKAKKCQAKGGVWFNNMCRLDLE